MQHRLELAQHALIAEGQIAQPAAIHPSLHGYSLGRKGGDGRQRPSVRAGQRVHHGIGVEVSITHARQHLCGGGFAHGNRACKSNNLHYSD